MQISCQNVSYTYQAKTPFEFEILKDISITFPSGSYTSIIGHNGSGKSTFLKLLNGLLKPTTGSVIIGEQVITHTSKEKICQQIKRDIGFAFQFSESQLFAKTVLEDVAFAALNFGYDLASAEQLAKEALNLVRLPASYIHSSPFNLSGGQRKKVALAGILALQPKILLLDEVAAGLDPTAKQEIMQLIKQLQHQHKVTIISITHCMEDAAEFSDQIMLLEQGQLIKLGTATEIFDNYQWLASKKLSLPKYLDFAKALIAQGMTINPPLPITEQQLAKFLQHLQAN